MAGGAWYIIERPKYTQPIVAGGGGGGTFAAVTAGITATGSPTATTGSLDTTGADLIVIAISFFATAGGLAVSDNKSNFWSPLTAQTANNSKTQLYYCVGPTVGSGHTFSVTGTNLFGSIAVQPFSGCNQTSPFDQQNGAGSASTTTLQPGSVTPSVNNELVITSFDSGIPGSAGAYTIDSGFSTVLFNGGGGSDFGVGLSYLIQTTAAAVNPTWTITNLPPDQAATAIATFKAA